MISHWQKNANGVKIHKIIGADPSSGMLEVAQKKFPHIHFMQCEATNLPFQNKEFGRNNATSGSDCGCNRTGMLFEG